MKYGHRSKMCVLVLASVLSVTACTTASYGLKPDAVTNQNDTYKFKVYVGGFSGHDTADNAVNPDIAAFEKNSGYKSHEILDKRYNFIPSYFEYTVHFAGR
ncbi:hypothetical protein GN109_10930 [Collimonas pratensis]|uniref:hypothetical protein n=1 Tax=Collimonas pratensis TaxID=279113 RepID=UPI00143DD4FD|nr:hypothetical protein [Collimonas pratensis]NKI69935.1 hypothetical protein [Collimonas pratensis]